MKNLLCRPQLQKFCSEKKIQEENNGEHNTELNNVPAITKFRLTFERLSIAKKLLENKWTLGWTKNGRTRKIQ